VDDLATKVSDEVLKRAEEQVLQRVARGEFGVIAAAKAAAPGAFRRLQIIAKTSEDEKVRLTANLKLIELAGIRPPAPVEQETPERIMDMMTADELREFAKSRTWPERLADRLARLPVAVLQAHEREAAKPKVDAVVVDHSTKWPAD
jgi:hypothetical protein